MEGERVGAGASVAAVETHAGVVFFIGDRAYKMKKALDLGFWDFRTRDSRRLACHREVSLNRRLAPDVYLGVADVFGPDGQPCEHLVVMRRMPDDRRLSSLVTQGEPAYEHLDRLAALIAGFHRSAETSPQIDEAATPVAELARWEANHAEMARFVPDVLDAGTAGQTIELARRFVDGRRRLFDQRVADGCSRDGHGDLLADDIFCLDDGPRVLDCLEFDDRLRFGDVLADVTFLAMDLERLGRADLSAYFLDRYRESSGQSWPGALAHHYIGYRAQVRAKVACLRWEQDDENSRETAAQLLEMCLSHLRQGRVQLVLVGGLPGTGKSTVAKEVAEALGAAVLRSDEVRRELSGTAYDAVASEIDLGRYDPAITEATYSELLARARDRLGMGQTVVLDATWRHAGWRRAAARTATEALADLVEIRCVAPLEVAVERVNRRRVAGGDPSEATEKVVRVLWANESPWPSAVPVDTSGELSGAVSAALEAVRR